MLITLCLTIQFSLLEFVIPEYTNKNKQVAAKINQRGSLCWQQDPWEQCWAVQLFWHWGKSLFSIHNKIKGCKLCGKYLYCQTKWSKMEKKTNPKSHVKTFFLCHSCVLAVSWAKNKHSVCVCLWAYFTEDSRWMFEYLMQSLVHSYETFSLNTVYCLLFLDLYSNASSCYFLSTCVVPLCTIRLAIMGCFARLPQRRCFCLDVHVPQTQQPLSERSLMSPSLSLSLSLPSGAFFP